MRVPRLSELIRRHCPQDGRTSLAIPGIHLGRYSKISTELAHATVRPVMCIVAQGAKAMILGNEVYHYDASRLLVLSVDLPVTSQVIRASRNEPYLSVVVDLNSSRIAELTPKVFPYGLTITAKSAEKRGLFVTPAIDGITQAATRLLELLAEPDEAVLLAPLVMDEILLRLLRSPIGPRIAQIGMDGSNTLRISKAVEWLRLHYAQPMRVEDLADLANMSVSSFHQHFKELTSMSPVHYQKVLRLQEARRLMLVKVADAGDAARQVGYLSASQFSREYARHFGYPPTKDIARLHRQGFTAADVIR